MSDRNPFLLQVLGTVDRQPWDVDYPTGWILDAEYQVVGYHLGNPGQAVHTSLIVEDFESCRLLLTVCLGRDHFESRSLDLHGFTVSEAFAYVELARGRIVREHDEAQEAALIGTRACGCSDMEQVMIDLQIGQTTCSKCAKVIDRF